MKPYFFFKNLIIKKIFSFNRASFRFWFINIVALALLILLSLKIFDLQVINRHFLQIEGDKRALRYDKIIAHRGIIFDRNHMPLAVSTPVSTIWVNPSKVDFKQPGWNVLARLLDENKKDLFLRIQSMSNREFMYLKRQIPPKQGEAIDELSLSGVHILNEYKRYYPAGAIFSQVVGITNIDDQGQEGIELTYNDWLKGQDGEAGYILNRKRKRVWREDLLKAAIPGKDLILSLDERIQYLAYTTLKQAIEKHAATSGSIVMVNVKTGEILAMVSLPSYNPNNRELFNIDGMRNRVLTDALEPGSTIKPFTVAAALQTGSFKPLTPIDTTPGVIKIDGYKINDVKNFGKLNVTSVIAYSSNVGISKIAMKIGIDPILSLFSHLGFGRPVGIGFPGENSGYIPFRSRWSDVDTAVLGFGYGFSVTALQLVQAYAVLGAGGILHPLTLFKVDKPTKSVRIIPEAINQDILKMLRAVVVTGSGKEASIPTYQVGGKTGTVRKIGNNGYNKNQHIGLFAGLAPIENPLLATVVIINKPKQAGYYGGVTAAPVFAKVNLGALRILDVAPVKLPTDPLTQ